MTNTSIYNRRRFKLENVLCSLFTSSYVYLWKRFKQNIKLLYPPTFDSRIILYQTSQNVRDYLSWRQIDCHINNLYNILFWKLIIIGKKTEKEARLILEGTSSYQKKKILLKKFRIKYTDEPSIFKKGTIYLYLYQSFYHVLNNSEAYKQLLKKNKRIIKQIHEDIISLEFWKRIPQIFSEENKNYRK